MDLDFSRLVDMHREQKKHETGDPDALDDVEDEAIDEYLRGCNAHLPNIGPDPGPADYLQSMDVAALYSHCGS